MTPPPHQPFSLTEEHVNSFVPITGPAREQFIQNEETAWKSLPIPSRKYHPRDIDTAANLLSAIAFSDYTIPIPSASNNPSPKRKSTRKRRLLLSDHIIPGTRVAATTQPLRNQWFLATVLQSDADQYILRDEDCDEGEVKTFKVSRPCIRILPSVNQFLEPGSRVMAVYPDTTTFYPATTLKRKGRNWLVQFDDDEDDGDSDDSEHDSNDGRLVDASLIFRE